MTRLSPVTTGDRHVVIVLTATPSRWARRLHTLERDRAEVVITTEWLGSGGASGMIEDPTGYNDVLMLVVDLSGWQAIGQYEVDAGFPILPVAAVIPRDGWTDDQQAAYRTCRLDAESCGWTNDRRVWEHIDPRPAELLAWAAGWWAGRGRR